MVLLHPNIRSYSVVILMEQYDVFFINDNFKDCNVYLEKKLDCVANLIRSLDTLLDEIQKHEDVISEAESNSNINFLDDVDDTIEKMYLMHIESLKSTKDAFLLG